MAGKGGGGAWKVAYADFVTAMMAFFLVMWITAQNVEVKESIANYFNDPALFPSDYMGSLFPFKKSGEEGGAGSPTQNDAGNGRKQGNTKANPTTKKQGNRRANPQQKTGLISIHNGKNMTLGTVISFAEFSADLTDEAKQKLDKTAVKLLGLPNKIEIRGHATQRPPPPGNPFHDAWQLTYARCLATMEYLIQLGIEAERIRLSQAGPFEPQTIRFAPDWEKQNSRVEVFLLDEIANDLVGTREERDERFQVPR